MISTVFAALVASASPQMPVQLAQGYGGPPPPGYGGQMNPDNGPPQGYGGDQGYGGQQGDDGPPSPAQMAQQLRTMGYSADGVRILQAANANQQDASMQQRGDSVQRELEAAAMANPVDPARVSRALQASDTLNAQMAAQHTMEVARILGQLSPADRRIFAQSLLGSGDDQGGPGGDGPGGPPPQGGPNGY